MISLTLFSATATCACKKMRVFPICAARRSVGVGDFGFEGVSDGLEGVDLAGGAGVIS
jgi:hypothetical protein